MTTEKSIGPRETELLERVRLVKGNSTDDWLQSPDGEAQLLMARVCDALEEALKELDVIAHRVHFTRSTKDRVATWQRVLEEADGGEP